MIEIYVPVVVRQRDALSKEFSRGRPPYSSRFDTKRHKLDPTSRKLFTPLDGLIPRRTLVGFTMLSTPPGVGVCGITRACMQEWSGLRSAAVLHGVYPHQYRAKGDTCAQGGRFSVPAPRDYFS